MGASSRSPGVPFYGKDHFFLWKKWLSTVNLVAKWPINIKCFMEGCHYVVPPLILFIRIAFSIVFERLWVKVHILILYIFAFSWNLKFEIPNGYFCSWSVNVSVSWARKTKIDFGRAGEIEGSILGSIVMLVHQGDIYVGSLRRHIFSNLNMDPSNRPLRRRCWVSMFGIKERRSSRVVVGIRFYSAGLIMYRVVVYIDGLK